MTTRTEESFDTFTMTELMQLTDEDLDQLEALRDEVEGTAVWWGLWRAARLEQAERGGE